MVIDEHHNITNITTKSEILSTIKYNISCKNKQYWYHGRQYPKIPHEFITLLEELWKRYKKWLNKYFMHDVKCNSSKKKFPKLSQSETWLLHILWLVYAMSSAIWSYWQVMNINGHYWQWYIILRDLWELSDQQLQKRKVNWYRVYYSLIYGV